MSRKHAAWSFAAALIALAAVLVYPLYFPGKHWATTFTIQLYLADDRGMLGSTPYVPVTRAEVITFFRTSPILQQFSETTAGRADDFLFIKFPKTGSPLIVTVVIGARTRETSIQAADSILNACLNHPKFKNEMRLIDGPTTVEKN